MHAIHIIISGDVQGVGFRSWTRREANRLGIIGWVKNRDDGAVEIVAQGEDRFLEKFFEKIRVGPQTAWVEHADENETPVNNELHDFEVLY